MLHNAIHYRFPDQGEALMIYCDLKKKKRKINQVSLPVISDQVYTISEYFSLMTFASLYPILNIYFKSEFFSKPLD